MLGDVFMVGEGEFRGLEPHIKIEKYKYKNVCLRNS